jgi:DNA polymerase-1
MRNPLCKLCKRNEPTKTVCLYGHSLIGKPNPDIMVVIDNTNQAQDGTGSLTMGQGGTVLTNLLSKAGILDRCYLTAAIKCCASHKPIAKEIRECRKYLLEEIDEVKPKLIIAMGSIAVRALFDKTYTMKDLRQRFFDAFQTQVACTFSHNVIFTDPNKMATLSNDLDWIMTHWNVIGDKLDYTLNAPEFEYSPVYGLDVETTGLNPYSDKLLTYAIANPTFKSSIGINVNHPESEKDGINFPDLNTRTLVGHNLKFDIKFLEQHYQIKITAKLIDSSIAHAMIDENSSDNSLQALSAIYTNLGHYWDDIDKKNLINEPYEKVIRSNQLDAIVPILLMEKFYPELKRQGLLHIFNFVTGLIPIFVEMEQRGVYLNLNKLRTIYDKNLKIVSQLKTKYAKINLASGPQLQKILYSVLKCPVLNVTKKGKPSTDKDTLAALNARDDLDERQEIFIDDVLSFRKAEKNIDHLGELLEHTYDNRVHTTYNLAKAFDESGTMRGAVTGRLSSSEANLQNKPPEVREIFEKSPEFNWFVTADYSQIELRVSAYLSREPNLIKAFEEDKDVHLSVLCDIMGESYVIIESILKDENHPSYKKWKDYRYATKRINFGILYGIGAKHLVKLIRNVGIQLTERECTDLINKWYMQNSTLMRWMKTTEDAIIIRGMYKTIFERIRHLPGASRKTEMGQRVLRQGINFPIQSAASDICLLGIQSLDEAFKEINENPELETHLLMTVHDEISFETKIKNQDHIRRLVNYQLTDMVIWKMKDQFNIDFDIPLKVGIEIGTNWSK